MKDSTIFLSAKAEDFLLLAPVIDPKDQIRLLALSLAVWRVRNKVVYSHKQAHAKVLALRVYEAYKSIVKPAQKAYRKSKDKSAARVLFHDLYASLPPCAMSVFTDGSCFPKTKESGAGFITLSDEKVSHYSSHYLGSGTNNTAELQAVVYALRHIIELVQMQVIPTQLPIYIFSDSKYVLDLIKGASVARTNTTLVKKLLAMVVKGRSAALIEFFKVPGHADILQNEIVDYIAKRGAGGITSTDPPAEAILNQIRARVALVTASPRAKRKNALLPPSPPKKPK